MSGNWKTNGETESKKQSYLRWGTGSCISNEVMDFRGIEELEMCQTTLFI